MKLKAMGLGSFIVATRLQPFMDPEETNKRIHNAEFFSPLRVTSSKSSLSSAGGVTSFPAFIGLLAMNAGSLI